jgi:glutathione S-transferase
MVLYERATCWKCVEVREVLERLGLEYEAVEVQGDRAAGDTLEALTGMRYVPVLVDGDTVVWDRRRIIRHLEEAYGGLAGAPPLPEWMGGRRTLAPAERAAAGHAPND